MGYYEVPVKRFLSDEERERREIALAKWQKMRGTKYSDREIRKLIADHNYEGVHAMIAYNRMIDERTNAAQRSWRE